MADNVTLPGTGVVVASDDIGAGLQAQYIKLMDGTSAGTDVITGTTANGLDVDVTRIAAGDNNIGNVDIASAIPAGDNNIGNVDIVSLPAGNLGMQAMAASMSTVPASNITDATYIGDIKFGEALPAGTNAIGKLAANSGVDIGDVDVLSLPALAAGTNLIGKVQPMSAMLEGGLTELVGINEQVDQNDYSGSIGVALGGSYSGEILAIGLYATEDGTGAVQDSAGILYVFDADPSINSGDTAISAAARVTILGKIGIGAADWDTDANGGFAYVTTVPIPFHAVSTLYFAWKHLDATALNDAAGDDEQLEFNFWWRRES